MKKIKLTQGQVTLVDDYTYNYLIQWKWYAHKKIGSNSYYAVRRVRNQDGKQRMQYMHKVILGIDGTSVMGDHKNNNTLDNQRHNLREATKLENNRNRKKNLNNTSGYKGVYKDRIRGFKVSIKSQIAIHLGYFDCPIQAAKMYDFWARDLHGEFATTNFPGKRIG